MRYFDLMIQSTLILLSFVFGVTFLAGFKTCPHFLEVQFLLAAWQFVPTLTIALFRRIPAAKKRYLRITSAHLCLLMVFAFMPQVRVAYTFMQMYLLLPFWSLATYYYVITWRTTFPRNRNGKFLPHLSF